MMIRTINMSTAYILNIISHNNHNNHNNNFLSHLPRISAIELNLYIVCYVFDFVEKKL